MVSPSRESSTNTTLCLKKLMLLLAKQHDSFRTLE